MSNEIKAIDTSGQTLYAVVFNEGGQVWSVSGSSFGTPVSTSWTHYAVSLSEVGSCGFFTGSFPSIATAGQYWIFVYEQQGASPAVGDFLVASGARLIQWSGSTEVVPVLAVQGNFVTVASSGVNVSEVGGHAVTLNSNNNLIAGTDMTEAVPQSNTAQTVGDALNAARSQGFGKWVISTSANTLTLYAGDGTTVVRTFDLTPSAANPTQRT